MRNLKRSIAVGLLAIGANPLFAGGTFNVFEAGSGGAAGDTQEGTVVGSVKYNPDITANIDEQSTLVLNLDFLNESTQLDVVSVNKGDSGVSYSATSASLDILNVAVSNGVMLGSFNHNGKLYKFKPAGSGDTLVVEMPELSESALPAMSSGSAGEESLEGSSGEVPADGTDDGSMIDVIVAYTAQFVADVGGLGNVDAYMLDMESQTNLSFQLSDVNTRVHIVDSFQTGYGESTNFRKDAVAFTSGTAGQELRTQRDNTLADIMVVMTGNEGYDSCGYSAGFDVEGVAESNNGYNALALVREGCGTGYYGFAHQLGFIFGADLNPGNSNMMGGGEDYAHGYCATGWRSIMAYNCSGSTGGKRFPFWSNPNKTYNGVAMGEAGVTNNAKVLNDRALEVSNFRSSAALPGQVALMSPIGVSTDDTTPTYQWQPVTGAASYSLKVIDHANGNVLIDESYTSGEARCASGICSVTPTTVHPFGVNDWTVTASNASGDGPISATAQFGVTETVQSPGHVNLIAPLPGGILSDNTPTFTWEAISSASAYRLVVSADPLTRPYLADITYTPDQVDCQGGGGDCSVTPNIALPDGPTLWVVQTFNTAGNSWSEVRSFTVLSP